MLIDWHQVSSLISLVTATYKENVSLKDCQPLHLLQLFYAQFVHEETILNKDNSLSQIEGNHGRYLYYSAKKLNNLRIHFQRSKNNFLIDVEYKSPFLAEILKLPLIIVNDTAKSMLLNLVAYEITIYAPLNIGLPIT